MFKGCYSGKKVMVTSHTGFKGSWLSAWLLKLGADVVGISKDVPTNPVIFEVTGLWIAFQGLYNLNLLQNIAVEEHDPTEADNVDLETIPFVWKDKL